MPIGLLPALAQCRTLTHLSLSSCNFTGMLGPHALALTIKRSLTLQSFRLAGPAGLDVLAFLSLLSGSGGGGRHRRFEASASETEQQSTGATVRSPVESSSESSIMVAAAAESSLLHFHLENTELSLKAAAALGRCLMPGGYLDGVTSLRLSGDSRMPSRARTAATDVGDDVAARICRVLRSGASQLRSVHIAGSPAFSNAGAR